MAYSQTDLDKLDAAIASGTLSVEFNGRRKTYQSLNQLIAARKFVADQIAEAGGSSSAVRRGAFRVTFGTHRGF